MIFNIDSMMKHSYSNDDTCFSIDVVDEILEEYFNALLDEGSKILHSIEGTLVEEEIFSKFDEFMAMIAKTTDISGICPSFRWRVCIDYHKLDEATAQDYFPLRFMDQMLERLAGNKHFFFLDGFSGYFQIPIDLIDQEKTTFTCPFGTYAYRRMPFGLCNAPTTFQRCMLEIFHDMIEESVEVFMDDFSVFRDTFDKCLNNLDKMLQHCKDAHLVLNWEKCHFMVKEKIMLGHKVSSAGLVVDKAKIDVISKLPPYQYQSSKAFIQDAKPCLIRWILLLQEFNIEIKDRKGTKNFAADHLSQIENEEISDDSEVGDKFPGETLIEINTGNEPWFADFANNLVADIIPKGMTY
nr:reverse transcriptase domain-containing protein [Tanacetum cinerariifolium]